MSVYCKECKHLDKKGRKGTGQPSGDQSEEHREDKFRFECLHVDNVESVFNANWYQGWTTDSYLRKKVEQLLHGMTSGWVSTTTRKEEGYMLCLSRCVGFT